jgi:nucleotide-binding universal stress UspA family protein
MTTIKNDPTIVVGYDGSAAARSAVECAMDRAIPDGRLVVVSAWQVPVDFRGALYYSEMIGDASRHAKRVLSALEAECERLADVEHEFAVVEGAAAAAIIQAAEDHDADEIVIGSRGVGRVRALLGSVAHDVIHHAVCPVIVIPERMVDARNGTPAKAGLVRA